MGRKRPRRAVQELIHRFLLHVLPEGFVRIRHYGLLANRSRRQRIARCGELLAAEDPPAPPTQESVCEKVLRLTGRTLTVEGQESREEIELGNDPTETEDAAFIRAVATGDRSLIRSDYEDAVRSLALTLAATRSALEGRIVEL